MPHVSPRSRLARRALIFGGSVVGAGLLAWGVHALARLGPRDAAESAETERRVSWTAAQRELAAEVAALEQGLRETAAGRDEAARPARIERAIALQRELVQASRHAPREEIERLERLEGERDTVVAQEKQAKIAELEQAVAPGGEATAATLRAMLQLQQEINRSRAAARDKNFVRETRLRLQLEAAEAAPWRARVDGAIARAAAAEQGQDWPEVLAAKREARDALAELNQRWPKSKFADLRRHGTLAKEVDALEAAGAAAEVEAREKGGEAAATAGRADLAAEFYQAAIAAQTELNRRYAGSRFASARRTEELEVKRQTVLAAEAWREAAAVDGVVRDRLRQRQVANALAQLAVAVAMIEKIETTWPKSREGNGALKLRLGFLARHRADLRALQDEIYAQLLPVPGVADRLMGRTEVTQELFARIMNTNPSRNAGPNLPVDTVDWADAQGFCERVSWLLGTAVSLPTENEFRQAWGGGGAAGWTLENSRGQSHAAGGLPANANGFCDLAGNLAEWLHDETTAPTAPVAGGSYLDAAAAREEMSLVVVAKTTRARHIGFRVVVALRLEQR